MGLEKFTRPILAPGFQISGGSTFTGDIIMSSTVSAGVGIANAVQTISLSGASGISGTQVTNRGVTFITSTGTGAGWTLNMAAPGVKGVEKTVFIYLSGASTVPVTVRTASSSHVFFGSTRNSFSVSTAAGSTYAVAVNLIAKSSVQWALKGTHGGLASTAFPWITTTGATA